MNGLTRLIQHNKEIFRQVAINVELDITEGVMRLMNESEKKLNEPLDLSKPIDLNEANLTKIIDEIVEKDIKIVPDKKKITSAEARAMIRKEEELFFEKCPHCNGTIAIYLNLNTTAAVHVPKPEDS